MKYNAILGKMRTVRLSSQTDKRIEAVAAQKGRTASELIRETLENEFATPRETPGQWLLRVAKFKPDRKPGGPVADAIRRRHKQIRD